ncbi:MAG: peptidoglycan DD-metalloendopeptidase family protein [Bacteroides sp.]|nr:peptidoglycan DD-metalloendopeptidase family protein [Bacteroides sp.]
MWFPPRMTSMKMLLKRKMRIRPNTYLILLVSVTLAWTSVYGQGNLFGALDYVGAPGSAARQSALDYVVSGQRTSKQSALDYVSPSAQSSSGVSALDYVRGEGSSALDYLLSESGSASGALAGALAAVETAYSSNSYYAVGSWDASAKFGFGSSSPAWSGGIYLAPQWGRITSKFGYRPKFGRMHKGIDIAMNVGDTVRVPLPGKVDRVNYEAGGYGHYIVIKHDNGLETRYAHLTASLVAPGQSVSQDQPIALSGNTGNSTGPHLHFETRVMGNAVDPTTVFDFAGGKVMNRGKATFMGMTPTYGTGMPTNGMAESSDGFTPKPTPPLAGKSTYVVRAGDTLQGIASKAGISIYRLCQLNFITTAATPAPGTMLKLR